MCPYEFKLASSAHLAATQENTSISTRVILEALKHLESHFQTVLIEGLGGICVPINEHQTTLDILKQTKTTIILVVENKIGCINHSLLTQAIIQSHNLNCAGFIMNNKNPHLNPLIQKDNSDIISKHTGLKQIGYISQDKKLTLLTPLAK